MEIYELSATCQKSFYGKAKVIIDGGETCLQSYNTIVCKIVNGEFLRLWNGYSVTTMKHVNDFRYTFGLPALSAKDWRALPCANGNSEKYKCEFSNGFVSWTAGVTFDNEDDAWNFVEGVQSRHNYRVYGGVVSA